MTVLGAYADPDQVPVTQARRLGALMGLPDSASRSEVALAETVARGLPVEAIDHLAGIVGRGAVIGPVVAETTYRRTLKAKEAFTRDVSDRIYDLSRVMDAAARVYHGDRQKMRRFLEKPHMLLESKSPLAVATASAAGADAVVALIERAEAGFAV